MSEDETPTGAAPTEATDDTAEMGDAERIAQARVSQQFNAHDAKVLEKQVDQMILALRNAGFALDHGRIKAAADAQAACEVLVAHGLVTEAELRARAYLAARAILAQLLQQVEEQRLAQQQQQRGVQAVRKPGIVVARH